MAGKMEMQVEDQLGRSPRGSLMLPPLPLLLPRRDRDPSMQRDECDDRGLPTSRRGDRERDCQWCGSGSMPLSTLLASSMLIFFFVFLLVYLSIWMLVWEFHQHLGCVWFGCVPLNWWSLEVPLRGKWKFPFEALVLCVGLQDVVPHVLPLSVFELWNWKIWKYDYDGFCWLVSLKVGFHLPVYVGVSLPTSILLGQGFRCWTVTW